MIDENFSANNQETEQENATSTPDISAASEEKNQLQSSSTQGKIAVNQVTSEKEIGVTTTPTNLHQERSSKIPNKGLDDINAASADVSSKNPFNKKGTSHKGGKGEFPNQSPTEEDKEKNKYKDIPDNILETWRERYQKEIEHLDKNYNKLREEIEGLDEDYNETDSQSQKRTLKKKIEKLESESQQVKEKLEQREEETEKIKDELNKRNATKNKNHEQSHKNDSSEIEIISATTLFKEDQDIENTVFYVATLFPGLNAQDFKRVVGLLLKGRKKSIPVNTPVFNNDIRFGNSANNHPNGGGGNIGVGFQPGIGVPLNNAGAFPNYQFQSHTPFIEEAKTKELTEIWQESFDKPDQYLKKCHLKVERQDGKQVITFSHPELRENFIAYFESEQIFYFEQQLQRTQELDLLLDSSQEVADNAINIAVKTAVYSPNNYAEDWLIELLIKIADEDEKKQDILLERLSRLIYRLQIEPEYLHSETIAQKFLDRLISPQYRKLAFSIIRYLIYLHLRTGLLGMQSARNILNWLRQLLDSEDLEQEEDEINNKYSDIKSDIYNLLEETLWQSGFHLYIYELLEILKEWLPEKDTSPARYSPSNIAGLLLLFAYCGETTLKLDLKWYGKGYYVYPLFAPLKGSPDSNVNEEFDTLVSWLLYPSQNGDLAVKYVLEMLEIDENNPLETIGFFIAEWFVIIWGFKDEEPEKEALNLFDNLLRRIILIASRSQQRQITERWTELTEEYLDKSVQYEESGNKELKKEFIIRRKLLRELKKRFKALQQENLESN
ncbi:hypothetical protein DSM106972_092910 [Dulcicalothrix desertica PCC 7102]|uniref:Uncharacterized protein n=1 Tax=Dulcicalothrix desertica PCC 7102 TaxID=232991 RepID=A0A433ULG3_9CYAN|nr:hypothetical protein [Dulcicalothrix desertica]RUS94654.1 hypothetical protein DSM106972_092910 [Dulcicalothrix desertica PCC 7102]TWH62548.1 hypothetical protein CAL7102_00039 [Dulcicalothrix desertica PCC 7102]